MTETICPIYCYDCAGEVKGSVVILKKHDYMRLKQFGTSGCACETENGGILELCCAHNEYYQHKLTKLREAFAKLPTDDDIIDLYTNKQIVGFFLDIKILVQAVKELLEENKP